MTDAERHIDYCRDMVRADDTARFEVSLFAPREAQPAIWALLAFNQEVAKTRESISEAALGEIRLQWWRDVIEELRAGKVREHPVVAAMAATIRNTAVFDLLEELIDARAQDLYDEGPADQPALEAYAYAVGGALNEAMLHLALSEAPGDEARAAVRDAGAAWAMLGLVRAIPFHWASNRNYVPGDAGRASLATTDADKMFDLAEPSIKGMMDFVQARMKAASGYRAAIAKQARHLRLLEVQTRLHARAIEAAGGNPFKAAEPSALKRLTALMLAALTGRY